jgi:hypothetical protein
MKIFEKYQTAYGRNPWIVNRPRQHDTGKAKVRCTHNGRAQIRNSSTITGAAGHGAAFFPAPSLGFQSAIAAARLRRENRTGAI